MKQKICKVCGDKYTPERPLQLVCSPKCAIKYSREHLKAKHTKMLSDSGKTKTKLENKADKLYQIKYKEIYPYSAISGEPTQAIHHYVFKSDSNNTRYDPDNAVPVTIAEHRQIHDDNAKHAGALHTQIALWLGEEKLKRLDQKRRIDCKLTESYLREVIKELSL